MRRSMRFLVSLLLAVALLAAACGDDGGGNLAGVDGGSGGSDGSDDGGGEGSGGAGVGGGFCDFIASFDQGEQELDTITDFENFDFEELFTDIESQLGEARLRAPDEIADDVAVVADGVEQFVEYLRENDWNFFAAAFAGEDDPRLAAIDSPEFNAANDRISEYCGLPTTDSGDFGGEPVVPPDPGDGSLPDGIEPPDFSDIDMDDPDAIAVEIYKSLGHDQATAECLAAELGPDADPADISVDSEVCGLSFFEIFSGASG